VKDNFKSVNKEDPVLNNVFKSVVTSSGVGAGGVLGVRSVLEKRVEKLEQDLRKKSSYLTQLK
jgi:hypothetical protein